VLTIAEARKVLRIVKAEYHIFGKTRGLIGALAAIGSDLEEDHTFELIAYRTCENFRATPRKVDRSSIRMMARKYHETTFNNIDPETGRILICPHGPDPVLFGIRGEEPASLIHAFNEIRIEEPVSNVMIFRTNQGTDAHLNHHININKIRPYISATISGVVEKGPIVVKGGHVIFTLRDVTGIVDCAAYKPTGNFRTIARNLVPGDTVIVHGGVRRSPSGTELTLNLEKLEITSLVEKVCFGNPLCSDCQRKCESMGKDQGFRCRKCGRKYPRLARTRTVIDRGLNIGSYLPPPRAHRHLSKPMNRIVNRHFHEDSMSRVNSLENIAVALS
jgi:tRNA(Ile2)-agmatinylcytidine synthase